MTLLCSKHIPKAPGVFCQNFIEIDLAVTKIHYMTVLWGIVTFSGLNTLFWHTFSHAATRSGRPNCSSHSCTCKTATEPTIDIARDTILWLEYHGAVWWLPAVSQISGELVHPAKHSSGGHQRIPLRNPTPLDSSTCSISWATLAAGNSTVGNELAQLMRLRGRRSELQPSWTTCHQQWTMQYRNAVESTNWKMFASDLESHQMN